MRFYGVDWINLVCKFLLVCIFIHYKLKNFTIQKNDISKIIMTLEPTKKILKVKYEKN